MTKLEKLILKKREEIRELRRKLAAGKLIEEQKRKENLGKRGRPPINHELLEKARELGKTNPLPFVAFKLSIALRTMYRYGITRSALNKEKTKNKLIEPVLAKSKE